MAGHSDNRDDPRKQPRPFPFQSARPSLQRHPRYTHSDSLLMVQQESSERFEDRDRCQRSPTCSSSTTEEPTTNLGTQNCVWPISGCLKRTTIEGEARYTVEFGLEQFQEHCALPFPNAPPYSNGTGAEKNRSAQPVRSNRKYTQEEDDLLVDLKEKQGLSWKDIQTWFPGRGEKTLQVHYSSKLRQRMSPSGETATEHQYLVE
jgi:hypothetical protein